MIDAHYIIRAVTPYSGFFQREGGKQKGKGKKKQASFLYSNVLTSVIKAQRNVKVKKQIGVYMHKQELDTIKVLKISICGT